MQFFTILQDKLHASNIQDNIEACFAQQIIEFTTLQNVFMKRDLYIKPDNRSDQCLKSYKRT